MVLYARHSNLFNEMVGDMAILTEVGNLNISFKQKKILPQKLSSSSCHALAYLP